MMMTLLNPPPLDSPCHLLIVNGNNCCQQFGILGLGLPLRVEHLPSTCQALDSILGTTHTHTQSQVWYLIPVIPATGEMEMGR
jgi:hypothetical protein